MPRFKVVTNINLLENTSISATEFAFIISFVKGKYSAKKNLFLRENVNHIVKITLKSCPLRPNYGSSS